jgi:hypothetical protein
MDIRRFLIFVGILAVLGMLIPAPQVMASSGIEPPPADAIKTGPELWGVVVVFCHEGIQDFGTIRVKRIVGCNAEMQAIADPQWPLGCPASADDAVGHSLPEGTTFFGIPTTAYINKVKLFQVDTDPNTGGTVVSFEAQFKFWHRP